MISWILYYWISHKIISAARAFMLGFNLMKPFISKHTLAKISFFGTDFRPALEECLPPDAIPTKFGGCSKQNHVYDIVYDGIMTKLLDQQLN